MAGGVLAGVSFLEFGLSAGEQAFVGTRPTTPPLERYAEDVLVRCKSAAYRLGCYDEEVPKLMSAISMEDAFAVTRLIQEKDPEFRFCHVLGHNLSAQEVKKDPSRWKDVLARCPSGVCSNGCLHGGLQERFRAETLSEAEVEAIKPDLETLCEARPNWQPTGLEQGSCYHALGHLTMYLTSADIAKATTLCEELAVKPDGRDFSPLCFDGAFMQIFQPLEPEDFALVHGKQPSKQDAAAFCRQFSGARRASCHSESWPLFRDELMRPEGLTRFCGEAPAGQETRCYRSLVYVLTAQFNFDTRKLKDFCAGLTPEWRGFCFANVASRLIETDYRNIEASVALCRDGAPFDPEARCFSELVFYATYNFHAGSPEFFELCGDLPDPWRVGCLNRGGIVR
ncbi:MAG: hypothetical protein Q8R13_00745 [bacterium]|nr:hypothetical protein [bacterium]MDZ4296134.1 hypothetical protein [Patescibacteria group bacterium]